MGSASRSWRRAAAAKLDRQLPTDFRDVGITTHRSKYSGGRYAATLIDHVRGARWCAPSLFLLVRRHLQHHDSQRRQSQRDAVRQMVAFTFDGVLPAIVPHIA